MSGPLWKAARDSLLQGQTSLTTEKRNREGTLLQKLERGGHTLAIDHADSSTWLAGRKRLFHYSNEGKKRGYIDGLSDSQSYVIVLPTDSTAGGPTAPPGNR